MEVLLSLLFLLLAVLPVVVAVLAIVAFARSQRIAELLERVARLEAQVRRLRADEAPQEVLPVEEPAPAKVEPAVAVKVAPSPPPARPRPEPAVPAGLEAWIGRRLGWIAVVLFVFAAAFFLKYAFDNNWIGELGRVAIGVVIGAGLCAAGLWQHLKGGKVLSEVFNAAGIIVLYLSTYAAFGFYSLVTQEQGGVFLVALMALAALLAVAYDSPVIALMSVAGGLLTPVLLASEQDRYVSLFVYLAALSGGAVGLARLRPWPALRVVALLGVHGLWWAWYSAHFHPEKELAALAFLAVIFALFLASCLWTGRRRRANGEDGLLVVLNPLLFFAAGYRLLAEDYPLWMGTFAVLIALVCTAGAVVVSRRRDPDPLTRFLWPATGLAFLAAAVPLQVHGMEIGAAWASPFWAVEGMALWWFGLRVRLRPARVGGVVLLVVAVFRLLTTAEPFDLTAPYTPILNTFTLAGSLTAAAVLGAAFAARRFVDRLEEGDTFVRYAAGLTGVALVWLLLSREVYDFCTLVIVQPPAGDAYRWQQPGERLAQTALSAAWTAYAALLLWLGFRLNHALTRWTALGVFAVTVAKVFLFDLSGLDGLFRILAFFILSVVLAAAAWGYQKFQARRRAAAPEGTVDG